MTKAILFTGEAGCGKGEAVDTIQEYLVEDMYVPILSCKDHLHELTQVFFNVDPETYWTIYGNREDKEKPNSLFRISSQGDNLHKMILFGSGLSDERVDKAIEDGYVDFNIREAMIFTSECVAKPTFGTDYFGKVRASKVKDSYELILDDSASAFSSSNGIIFDEADALMDKIGKENVYLIRIERPDNPHSVSDSRKPIPKGIILPNNDFTIINEEGKLEDFRQNIIYLVEKILED